MLGSRIVRGRGLLLATLACGLTLHSAAGGPPQPVEVYPPQISLCGQQTQQLLVMRGSEAGADWTARATYESAEPRVATVTSDGRVIGRHQGETHITVRAVGFTRQVPVVVTADRPPTPRFRTDVVPVLTKHACNSGGCHGKATGQNGFKLSLLGFDARLDYRAIVRAGRGRRIFPSAPDRSLLLAKATASVPHGGGKRLQVGTEDYRVLWDWIAGGAHSPRADDPQVVRLEILPARRVMGVNDRQQLLVTAHLSDGARRDVTRQAVYLSNDPELAQVEAGSGRVRTHARRGRFSVMVRFGGKIGAFHGAAPYPASVAQKRVVAEKLAALEPRLSASKIDRLLLKQWRRLGIVPADPASDANFIRRATLDICGTLPTPSEVQSYVDDKSRDKKRRLIDRLLERPEYSSYFAMKWSAILQNRGAGYSTSKQRRGTALFAGWIRDSLAANKPYDQFVSEIITASGSQRDNPPTVWHRSVRTQTDYVEAVAQAFLGVRIQCAQCHHHPFERWSQADYYGLAAVFARVGRKGGFADAEVPTDETIYLKDEGEVKHPRTGARVAPRALGGPDLKLGRYDDPRLHFARWMTAPENPFFARTMANRMWAHFLGRGLIHPIDDARSTNPPTNPELLDALARVFIDARFDVKQLIRVITNSYAYGLESTPHEQNGADSQTYARFYPRRLPAEVLLDAWSQVLEAPTPFSGGPGAFPAGTRAIDLPDENVPQHFLDVFGRPARTSACECERTDAPALAQALELINSKELQRKLTLKTGWIAKLATNKKPPAENVREAFLRVFARPPRPAEATAAVWFLRREKDRAEAYRSLLWSLLATNEFMFNH